MNFKSLGLRTDLIFHRLTAQVTDCGRYVVVRTPSRPDYMWGNFIVMREPPAAGAFADWTAVFEREIGPKDQTQFMTFAWDDPTGAEGEIAPFLDFGFTLAKSTILTATSVRKPPRYNDAFLVRPLSSDAEWEGYLNVHFSQDWEYGAFSDQLQFLKEQRDDLRALVQAGHGLRFGAFLGRRLVAELGIYWDGDTARFNNIETAADFRRQGACSTLVHDAAAYILERTLCRTLVIEAFTGGKAAGLYETIGFQPTQQLCKIEWLAPQK